MPELPEVEVTRRQLSRHWVGETIASVWTSPPSYFFVTPPKELRRRLAGRTTAALTRHGKYILAHLDDGSRLLCHLGMTGQITARDVGDAKHQHLILELSSGKRITFIDPRKFGKVEWIGKGKTSERLERLGHDALSISLLQFQAALRRRSAATKTALLNQSVLAGVGNIYADEALYRAKVSPLRSTRELSQGELSRLLREIQAILKESVKRGGSTINDYMKPDGELGGYQDFHRVYGRSGEPCRSCKQLIVRVVLSGRSTHYCPQCQR